MAAVQAAYVLMDREVTTSKVEELVRSAGAAASSVDRVPLRCSCREHQIWIDAVPI